MQFRSDVATVERYLDTAEVATRGEVSYAVAVKENINLLIWARVTRDRFQLCCQTEGTTFDQFSLVWRTAVNASGKPSPFRPFDNEDIFLLLTQVYLAVIRQLLPSGAKIFWRRLRAGT